MPFASTKNRLSLVSTRVVLHDAEALAQQRQEIFTYAAYREVLAKWSREWVTRRRERDGNA